MKKDYSWDYLDAYEWTKRIPINQNPLVITVAVNGGVQGKEANEAIPETPEEIAASTYDAYNAGASAVHIHGRDPNCLYQLAGDWKAHYEINQRVRDKCPQIIINNTTGGFRTLTTEQRYDNLRALPEMASLNMGPEMTKYVLQPRKAPLMHPRESIEHDGCSPCTYGHLSELAQLMKDYNIKPEMEVYHSGQYWVSNELISKKLIEPPYVFQFVVGYQTSPFATPQNLIDLVRDLPKGSVFSTIGVGRYQWYMTTLSIILGGNVRVGLEDNIFLSRGVKLKSNAQAVEKIVRIAKELGREIATPEQAREIYGLSEDPRAYPQLA